MDSTATHTHTHTHTHAHTIAKNNGNGNPVSGDSGLNQGNVMQQHQVVIDLAQQNAAAQLAQQILANTSVTLKQRVIKLPEFYGQPEKDSISALDFISRIDGCQISNDWNDVTTFSNFPPCTLRTS